MKNIYKIIIIGIIGIFVYSLFGGVEVSHKAVIIDNSYGYPIAFYVSEEGMVGHNDPLFEEIAKHCNYNASEYSSAIIESGYNLKEMQKIEKIFLKENQ